MYIHKYDAGPDLGGGGGIAGISSDKTPGRMLVTWIFSRRPTGIKKIAY